MLIHPVGLFVCVYGLYGREEPLCVGACQMHNTDIVKCLRVGLGALFSGTASRSLRPKSSFKNSLRSLHRRVAAISPERDVYCSTVGGEE